MIRPIEYDSTYEPPAPTVPIVVSGPNGRGGVLVEALLDTGADATVIPEELAETLGLPLMRYVEIEGVAGSVETVAVHSAVVDVAGVTLTLEVVAFDDERIVGRDLLCHFVTRLDGPRQLLSFETRPAPRRSRGRR